MKRVYSLLLSCQILMDSEKREIYDKLGPEAAASKHPVNENTMLIEVRHHPSLAVEAAGGVASPLLLSITMLRFPPFTRHSRCRVDTIYRWDTMFPYAP